MFQQLKQKWKVNGTQLFLIVCVFAITGTTTAWLTRQITHWLDLPMSSPWYWILKIIMLLFGYQVIILLVSIPFRQFNFFWKYEKKILIRIGILRNPGSAIKQEQATRSTTAAINSPYNITNTQPVEQSSNQSAIDNWQPATGHEQAANSDAHQTSAQQETSNYKPATINVAVFASGAGSNAQKLIDHFSNHRYIKIALIVCNKPGAGVLAIAQKENIPSLLIEKEQFFRGNGYVDELRRYNIQFIVLAGFLWKVPVSLIAAYPQRIINIHPALLPHYGGKGMYGSFVHQAVIAAQEKESGISIHYVDELYDHGQLIFQARCTIEPGDSPETLAQKIHALEHAHYPVIVEKVISETVKTPLKQ
jgi:phosphoribosylglycinamide formyltransferase-1